MTTGSKMDKFSNNPNLSFYNKKKVAYELINSSIDLFLLDDRKFDVIIYNSVYTAWHLMWEIKEKWEKETGKKFPLTLEKEKLFDVHKEKGQNVNDFWNYLKHSKEEDYQTITGGDFVGINFHLLFNACQDFLRVFNVVEFIMNASKIDIEKFKIFSLTYSFIRRKEEPKLYSQLRLGGSNKDFFDFLNSFSNKPQNDFELIKYAFSYCVHAGVRSF